VSPFKSIRKCSIGIYILYYYTAQFRSQKHFHHFVDAASIPDGLGWLLVVACTALAFFIGFLVAAACGYMAGLVGSSASPISGIGIVSIVVISLVLLAVGESSGLFADEGNRQFMLALTLFCGSAVICVASISNDNLQDLKTGYLVKATPRLQQIALIIGCVAGAIVVSPVLELLYEAYGFTGAMPRAGMDASQALAAPQATLMTTITQGIFAHNLQWNYIFTGVGIGVALIIIDFILKKSCGNRLALPVLAVGMGIYLPPSVNMPIVVGAFLAAWLKSRIRTRSGDTESSLKRADRTGTLFAAGLIVGESLIGVAMAFVIAVSVTNGGSDAPLALGLKNWDTAAAWLGLAAFVVGALVLARRVKVYAYVPRFIHAKTLVIDDELSMIGTANMDNRSFRLNFEVMAAIYDKKTTSEMARQFLKDLESATQLHADHQPDSFNQRMVASLARLAAPLL